MNENTSQSYTLKYLQIACLNIGNDQSSMELENIILLNYNFSLYTYVDIFYYCRGLNLI